jgi:hypothetical protein
VEFLKNGGTKQLSDIANPSKKWDWGIPSIKAHYEVKVSFIFEFILGKNLWNVTPKCPFKMLMP